MLARGDLGSAAVAEALGFSSEVTRAAAAEMPLPSMRKDSPALMTLYGDGVNIAALVSLDAHRSRRGRAKGEGTSEYDQPGDRRAK